MLGGALTYNDPSNHIAPSGNIILSANTIDLSYFPSPFVSSNRTTRCGFSANCFSTFSLLPEESVTYNRPFSSKSASIGRSTNGPAATNSIVNPSGKVKVCAPILNSAATATPAERASNEAIKVFIKGLREPCQNASAGALRVFRQSKTRNRSQPPRFLVLKQAFDIPRSVENSNNLHLLFTYTVENHVVREIRNDKHSKS